MGQDPVEQGRTIPEVLFDNVRLYVKAQKNVDCEVESNAEAATCSTTRVYEPATVVG